IEIYSPSYFVPLQFISWCYNFFEFLVMPRLHILSARGLLHVFSHATHQIGRGHWLPAMPLHWPSIGKLAFAFGIVQILGHLLELVHRQIQIKIVHVSDIDMNLAL